MTAAPTVTVACVFNDASVRRSCLDRSLQRSDAAIEYIPVDNTTGAHATAGAALNHAVGRASGDYVAFVHQDVYLHDPQALIDAARRLASDSTIGLLGAMGLTHDAAVVGRIRDRVILLGAPAAEPTDVDSLDEVLFMAPTALLRRAPLTEDPALAWHAYAVEYGLRVRSQGLRCCALDIPLTHNSLTVNLHQLDLAYRRIAAMYPDMLPVQTPGGAVTATPPRKAPLLASQRWRYRWLRESLAVRRGRRALGGGRCVLGDIRRDVDGLLADAADARLLVVGLDRDQSADRSYEAPIDLERSGRRITFTSSTLASISELVSADAYEGSVLVTNLRLEDLSALGPRAERRRLLGFRREIGYWLVLGPAAEADPLEWRRPKARPLRVAVPAR